MIFCRVDSTSLQVICSILHNFLEISGLQINKAKSTISFGGVTAEDKASLLPILCFSEDVFPIRYLGLPLSPKKLRMAEYDLLLKKITARIQYWTSKHLSYASRLSTYNQRCIVLRDFGLIFFCFL